MRKKLMEQRAMKQMKMKALIEQAKTEERALSQEERESFDKLEQEIRDIDGTLASLDSIRELESNEPEERQKKEKTVEERDYEIFDAYIRNVESREGEMVAAKNGAVVPTTIANKIIEKVVDMCPIYHDADRYNLTGDLSIPYYDESSGDITVEYADEFTDPNSTSGTFKSINLKGYLARALTDVSKSLIINSKFDVVNFVVNRMARNIALFIEKQLLVGQPGKVDGLSKVKKTVTAASAAAITADELIDLQEEVPDVYQDNAYWIMNKTTRTAIRKLKDADGNYLLNKDVSSRWGYTLLGKDVYTSDNMPKITQSATAIYYGDMTGLAVKVSEEVNIEVLRELKAKQHAIEVLAFVEFDAKIQDEEKIAKLVMHSA